MSEKKDKSLLPMLAGVTALAIALVGGAAYFLARSLSQQITTGATLHKEARQDPGDVEVSFRGPMYPNGRRIEGPASRAPIELPVPGTYHVAANEYVTEDGLDEAIAYYRRYFASQPEGPVEEHLEPGGARWIEKHDKGFGLVVLKETQQKLHIQLILVTEE